MLFPATVTGELLEVVSSNVNVEQLEMERERRVDEREGFGSVKAAINFYRETTPTDNFQSNSSEEPSSRIGELHRARKNTGELSETKRVADSVKSEAENELFDVKKKVRELAKRVEESNSRTKAQIKDVEKVKKTRKEEDGSQNTTLMKQLENAKQELSKLKLDMASILEEKRRAEKETEAYNVKAESYSKLIEELTEGIEDLNEEQVLAELSRLEAAKEREAIEAQWHETTKQYSTKLDQTRKKINDMIKEIERAKELETRLAATTDDANVLESELKLVKEMDKRFPRNEKSKDLDLLQSITGELEAAKKELESIKLEGFNLMAAMDIIRTELNGIMEETARLNRKEARTDLTIQNLNSKLLRATAKLEAVSAAEEKAETTISNLTIALEQVKSEAEAAEKERILTIEETKLIKAEVPKTESETNAAEQRLQAALQELKKVKSSEAKALENLEVLSEKTMKNRALASRHSTRITISTFEYEYLTGSAVRAAEIADKRIAAAQAWVKALEASENEIQMKLEFTQRKNGEKRAKEEQEAIKTGQSSTTKRIVEGELETRRHKFEKNVYNEGLQTPRQSRRSSIKFTPTGRAKFQKLNSPVGRHTPRSASVTIKRKKVMPNLAKYFSGKSMNENL